jgi:hypothetical protein
VGKCFDRSNRQCAMLIVLISAFPVGSASGRARATSGRNQDDQRHAEHDNAILQDLFKDRVPDPKRLSLYPRAQALRALVSEQARATGERGVAVAYLLAVLHHKYAANRNRVVMAATAYIRKTGRATWPDEDKAFYVCDMFDRGDTSLLATLFDIGLHSDADLAEGIGTELGDVVMKRPRLFLASLARRPAHQQRELAHLAGAMDGGGMSDGDLRRVRASLKAIERSSRRLGPTARLCLKQIERANAQAHGARQP